MLLGMLFAPIGLVIPLIIRYLLFKGPLPKITAVIITALNLIVVITIGILILKGLDMSKSNSAVSIGGAISSLLAYKMLIESSEKETKNIQPTQNK